MASFTKRSNIGFTPTNYKRIKALQGRTGSRSREKTVMLAIEHYERSLDTRDALRELTRIAEDMPGGYQ